MFSIFPYVAVIQFGYGVNNSSERRGILWWCRGPSGLRWVWRQPLSGMLTSAARRARTALGSPTSTLATAAVIEGEGGPGQGPRTHAVVSALAPAHVPPLRGTLCGGGPGVREEPEAGAALPRSNPPSWERRPRASTRHTVFWRAQDDPPPHRPGSRGAGSRGLRVQVPRAGGTRSGRSRAG